MIEIGFDSALERLLKFTPTLQFVAKATSFTVRFPRLLSFFDPMRWTYMERQNKKILDLTAEMCIKND